MKRALTYCCLFAVPIDLALFATGGGWVWMFWGVVNAVAVYLNRGLISW